jgi:hypothetical protein
MASLVQIGVLFLLYVVLSGPVVLVFFRNRRRRTAVIYVLGLIGAAILVSLLVGPILGTRPGYLEWTTVAEVGEEGISEWGILTLTSAGGRSYAISLEGESPSAWLLPPETVSRLSAFSYHRVWSLINSAGDDDWISPEIQPRNAEMPVDMGRVENPGEPFLIPVSPWTTRILTANAATSDGRTLEVTLGRENGRLLIGVKNGLGATLHDLHLVPCLNTPRGWTSHRITLHKKLKPGMQCSTVLPTAHSWQTLQSGECFAMDAYGAMYMDNGIPGPTHPGRATFFPSLPGPEAEWHACLVGEMTAPLVLKPGTESFVPHPGRHIVMMRLPDDMAKALVQDNR